MSLTPFFHSNLLLIIETHPRTSTEWSSALNAISEDIKATENILRTQFIDCPDFKFETERGTFLLKLYGEGTQIRFCFKSDSSPEAKPVIELPLVDRLKAYRQFPELFDEIGRSEYAKRADDQAKNVQSKKVLEIIREAFDKVKDGALAGPKMERLVDELKRLRLEAPKGESDIKSKATWFKHLAETLMESSLLQQVFDQVKTQLPQIWSQLTLAQKLKIGAIAPIVGAGAYLGSIGIAGGGSAIGLPVVLVILILLMMNNSLVDFLDWLIKQLSIIIQKEPSADAVAKVFEEVLNSGIKAAFGRNHDVAQAKRVSDPGTNNNLNPRDFELLAVSRLAKKYRGEGFVTRYSADGGIDGYIVCNASKEVLLVQAKHYQSKIGFGEVTQCLGTYFYWKQSLESKFPYPISKMLVACSTDYSIEAKKVAEAFSDKIILERILLKN